MAKGAGVHLWVFLVIFGLMAASAVPGAGRGDVYAAGLPQHLGTQGQGRW